MEKFSLDELAEKQLLCDDSTEEGVRAALEIAICSLSKNPAATFDLLGKLAEVQDEADNPERNKYTYEKANLELEQRNHEFLDNFYDGRAQEIFAVTKRRLLDLAAVLDEIIGHEDLPKTMAAISLIATDLRNQLMYPAKEVTA